MFKKKYHSAHYDFKTGFFYKFTLFLGVVLLAIYLLAKLIATTIGNQDAHIIRAIYEFSQSNSAEVVFAFSLILIAIGFMSYFLHCQFAKLAKIVEEIEKDEELEEIE